MKVLCCNMRGYGRRDGDNAWIYRKDLCLDVIRSEGPDIICFQELAQFADVTAAFPEYESYAMIDEPCGDRPMNAIFYRRDRYTRVSAGGYWLSETPHVPGSKSWDTGSTRLANWIRLEEKGTGREFRVVNTHLDHVSQLARENQAALIVADTRAYPDEYPQILTGDMNCDATNKAIGVLKAGGWVDTYGAIHGTENPGHTYHGFHGPAYPTAVGGAGVGKIDWIFTRGGIRAVDAEIIRRSVGGKFPSDHYFVSATLSLGT
ncbi:MAG: endonuclease/exonuclease/phosphatase family protein [Armatimonadetes bacterium]|nr:endonuclease/exonuclease/phosphatase family protein [Armatimonadota bacterium]